MACNNIRWYKTTVVELYGEMNMNVGVTNITDIKQARYFGNEFDYRRILPGLKAFGIMISFDNGYKKLYCLATTGPDDDKSIVKLVEDNWDRKACFGPDLWMFQEE